MKSQKDVVDKVIDYIDNNLEEELDLDKISAYAGYSKFYFNRIFTEETGCTIYKYLQTHRLAAAAGKLILSDKPISQIAYESGYNSQQAFSYAFKKAYLYPPKTYRDMNIFIRKQNTSYMLTCLYMGIYQKYKEKIGGISK